VKKKGAMYRKTTYKGFMLAINKYFMQTHKVVGMQLQISPGGKSTKDWAGVLVNCYFAQATGIKDIDVA
jgi:hypothetical protein